MVLRPIIAAWKLRGDRVGQYSIRVNQQWRICFRWTPGGPEDIEIADYH
jgi:proteic killer suppression protein